MEQDKRMAQIAITDGKLTAYYIFRKWDTHLIISLATHHNSLPCVKGGGTRKRDGGIVKVRF